MTKKKTILITELKALKRSPANLRNQCLWAFYQSPPPLSDNYGIEHPVQELMLAASRALFCQAPCSECFCLITSRSKQMSLVFLTE